MLTLLQVEGFILMCLAHMQRMLARDTIGPSLENDPWVMQVHGTGMIQSTSNSSAFGSSLKLMPMNTQKRVMVGTSGLERSREAIQSGTTFIFWRKELRLRTSARGKLFVFSRKIGMEICWRQALTRLWLQMYLYNCWGLIVICNKRNNAFECLFSLSVCLVISNSFSASGRFCCQM